MNSKILIVEDEPRLREVLCDYFRSKGELPYEAAGGAQALELAEEMTFDAIWLDIMMPELDGFSVCRAIRRKNDVPIIFITALSAEEDTLLGYELGADGQIFRGKRQRSSVFRSAEEGMGHFLPGRQFPQQRWTGAGTCHCQEYR